MLLKTILAMGLALLLMGLFTTWAYRKLHAGRDGEVAPAAIAPEFKPPPAPIEMQPRIIINEGSLGLAIGLSILAVFLFTRDGLWLRLLAWPAGALVLLFAGMFAWDVWNETGTRFLASADGVQIHDRTGVKDGALGSCRQGQAQEVLGRLRHRQLLPVEERALADALPSGRRRRQPV